MRQDRIKQILDHQDWIIDAHVINQSHLHNHHGQSPGTGESHYLINVELRRDIDDTRVTIHRKILNLLNDEFAGGLHAVSISVLSSPKS